MSDLAKRFEQAVKQVRHAPADGPYKPDNNEKLRMYALYRQASDGDAGGKRPGMLNVIERAKFDAWMAIKGTSRQAAMQAYVEQIESVHQQYG